MDEFNANRQYEAFKIPDRQQFQKDMTVNRGLEEKAEEKPVSEDGTFYEIEYGASPFPGVGKFVLKPQKIEEPRNEEHRELFDQMREIARNYRYTFDYASLFDRRTQHSNATIFYKQGMFMKDFEDDYKESKEFSQYFPYYQMMGYEQLRTYFSWRTEVRKRNIKETSLSYGFLYIYELLNNIGVNDPLDGLQQLMKFREAYITYNKAIDKYLIRWIKDYHIYYQLPHSFHDFVEEHGLKEHYPYVLEMEGNFHFYCDISKYDIRVSPLYTDGQEKLITDCFFFVLEQLKVALNKKDMDLDELIFKPTNKVSQWQPFKGALFYQWMDQGNRSVIISEDEIYMCTNNQWYFSPKITSESGRHMMGYIMKLIESRLRELTEYKHKLKVTMNQTVGEVNHRLKDAGISLNGVISQGVDYVYRESTKTVVVVDHSALSRIREEALEIQEKLIVTEESMKGFFIGALAEERLLNNDDTFDKDTYRIEATSLKDHEKDIVNRTEYRDDIVELEQEQFMNQAQCKKQAIDVTNLIHATEYKEEVQVQSSPNQNLGPWDVLGQTLSEIERKALAIALTGESSLKKYADECGIMLEVLVEGINEKAIDIIGDHLMDDEFMIYDDYKEDVKELIK